jgi:hypothetical protein
VEHQVHQELAEHQVLRVLAVRQEHQVQAELAEVQVQVVHQVRQEQVAHQEHQVLMVIVSLMTT